MKVLIIDATREKILLGLILNKNIYTGTFINSKKNYDKLTILIKKFLLKNKIDLDKIKQIYVNRGPGSYAGIEILYQLLKQQYTYPKKLIFIHIAILILLMKKILRINSII